MLINLNRVKDICSTISLGEVDMIMELYLAIFSFKQNLPQAFYSEASLFCDTANDRVVHILKLDIPQCLWATAVELSVASLFWVHIHFINLYR